MWRAYKKWTIYIILRKYPNVVYFWDENNTAHGLKKAKSFALSSCCLSLYLSFKGDLTKNITSNCFPMWLNIIDIGHHFLHSKIFYNGSSSLQAYRKCLSQFTDVADHRRAGQHTWHDESGQYANSSEKRDVFKPTETIPERLD